MDDANKNGAATAEPSALERAEEIAQSHGLEGGEKPKRAPKKEAEPEEPAVEEEPEVDAPAAEDEPEGADEAPARLGIRALTNEQLIALRRAEVPDETIDALPDAALIALADSRAARETQRKEHFESLKGKKPEAEGRQRQPAEEGAAAQASPATSEPATKAASRGLPEPVKEALNLDDEEVKPLEDWTRGEVSRAVGEAEARAEVRITALETALQEQRQEAAESRDLARFQAASSLRAEFAGDYPELAAAKVWTAVLETYDALYPGYKTGRVAQDMRRCMKDATYKVCGPPSKKSAVASDDEPGDEAPSTPSKAKTRKPKRAASPREAAEANAKKTLRKHGLTERGPSRW